ncbi:MAG: hypothetical protein FWG90_09735 [Oscillospiraceae bacterium]|nr:hypothetical protein [Oscillospiraceae bacterium]
MQRRYAFHTAKHAIRLKALALCVTAAFLGGCSRVAEFPDPNGDNPPVFVNHEDGEVRYFGDYVYASLSDSERAAYDAIVSAVRNMESVASLPAVMTPEKISKIYTLVYTQESDIFWLSHLFMRPSSDTDQLHLSYRYEKGRMEVMRGELELAVGIILGGLPPGATQYEALLYFHDTMIKNCEFSAESLHSNSAYGALVDGRAQCEGYAFAFSLLCDRAGIENIVVTGASAQGDSHAWNKVRLFGEWYNVDCTWDDPILKRHAPDFVRHDYFMVPDEDILNVTHFQNSEHFFPPISGCAKLIYYKAEGLYFSSLQEGLDGLSALMRSRALSGSNEAAVRFSDKVYYDAAISKLFDEGGLQEIISGINRTTGVGIKEAHKLTNDNLYIIHISMAMNS